MLAQAAFSGVRELAIGETSRARGHDCITLAADAMERGTSKTIPHAFGKRVVLKLMYAALIRASDSWCGVKMTEFELRQIQALREGLQRAHSVRIKPILPIDSPSRPKQASSSRGT